jgi:hypothetical protein
MNEWWNKHEKKRSFSETAIEHRRVLKEKRDVPCECCGIRAIVVRRCFADIYSFKKVFCAHPVCDCMKLMDGTYADMTSDFFGPKNFGSEAVIDGPDELFLLSEATELRW